MRRLVFALCLPLTLAACNNSTTAPTTLVGSTAALSFTSLTATKTTASTGVVYVVTFQLQETSGQSTATVNKVVFTLQNGSTVIGSATYDGANAMPAVLVPAGAAASSNTLSLIGFNTAIATQVLATLNYADSVGGLGTTASTTGIAQ